MAGRIIPGDAADPGAREAGVVSYIDRTLSGYEANLQGFYSRGVRELDLFSRARHLEPFAALPGALQDVILGELDRGVLLIYTVPDQGPAADEDAALGKPTSFLASFFALVREQTIQGFFCDPVYGGNRDLVGWRMVGFPGAQWGYSAEQMASGFDATTITPLSLAELRARRQGGTAEGHGNG
jgi:gluconate 2-dehydrogenase gamma chain